jgi:hypothetical protein
VPVRCSRAGVSAAAREGAATARDQSHVRCVPARAVHACQDHDDRRDVICGYVSRAGCGTGSTGRLCRYTGHDGTSGMAHMFTEYSDAEYRAERATSAALWHSEVGQFYSGERIYMDDLLPVPK